jgi:hypothetical protein
MTSTLGLAAIAATAFTGNPATGVHPEDSSTRRPDEVPAYNFPLKTARLEGIVAEDPTVSRDHDSGGSKFGLLRSPPATKLYV